MRHGSVLWLRRRRVGVGGTCWLGSVSHRGRLRSAAVGLGAVRQVGRGVRILEVGVRAGRPRRPAVGVLGDGRGGVCKGLCGRRILDVAGLGVSRGCGVCKRCLGRLWGLRGVRWPFMGRQVAVVAHGNGVARWSGRHSQRSSGDVRISPRRFILYSRCRIMLTRLPKLVLRGCSSSISCAVMLRFTRIAA